MSEAIGTMHINERHVVVGVATAAGIYGASRWGGAIPAVGGISPAYLAIAAGFVLAAGFGKEGMTGAAIEGVGYGLIAFGAVALASGR